MAAGSSTFHGFSGGAQSMEMDPSPSVGTHSVDSQESFFHSRPEFVSEDTLGRYMCRMCRKTLINPMQTPCAERVCRDCIMPLFGDEPITCPLTQYHQDSDEIMEDLECQNGIRSQEMFPDPGTFKEMQRLKVYCTNKQYGCPDTITWRKLRDHVNNCTYKPQQCENWQRGCRVMKSMRDLKAHRDKCDFALIPCPYCKKELIKRDLNDHLEECPEAESECTICSPPKKFLRIAHLNVHKVLEHPVSGGPCYYAAFGCNFEGKKSVDLVRHYKDNLQEHFHMMTMLTVDHKKTLDKSRDQSATTIGAVGSSGPFAALKQKHRVLEMFMGNLSAKVNSLEESMGEHSADSEAVSVGMRDIQTTKATAEDLRRRIEGIERKLGPSGVDVPSQIGQHGRTLQMHDLKIAEYDGRIKALEHASIDGVLNWKISEYKKKKYEAERGRVLSLYSEPFYTEKAGYKMCGRLYLNGDGQGRGKCLSLFFVLMKGNYDELLEWPFRRKVAFSLIAPGNPSRNKTETFQPDPDSSSFRRPTGDMNIASGCPQFAPISEVEGETFLKNDCIYIRIVVE